MRRNLYAVVEGLRIANYAVGAAKSYVGVKQSFERETTALVRARVEVQASASLRSSPSTSCWDRTGTCSARRRACLRSSRDAHRSLGSSDRSCRACSQMRRAGGRPDQRVATRGDFNPAPTWGGVGPCGKRRSNQM
jgi:hypothetical protein